MKPCSVCGRVGTVHWFGSTGCYGCNPPDPKDFELVGVYVPDAGGMTYLVERRFERDLIAFVSTYPITRNASTGRYLASVKYDTGRCGNDTFRFEVRPLQDWLQSNFGAFPSSDVRMKGHHAKHVRHMMERAAKDAKK
jgi:hypothetical protein